MLKLYIKHKKKAYFAKILENYSRFKIICAENII